MFDRFKVVAKNLGSFAKSTSVKVAAVAVGVVGITSSTFAQEAGVTLPETGVDISQYATTAIQSLGTVISVCVGGYFAFKLVKIGIKWAGSLLSKG